MARDLQLDENGDLVIDPVTHDLAMVSGIDEVAQRIKTTLSIKYGEMENLGSEAGADYRNFLGKSFSEEAARDDLTAALLGQVPEVQSLQDITFQKLAGRKLAVGFTAVVEDESGEMEEVKEDYSIEP
jgi:hypothetical protein